jgi:hypothetical protein
MSADAKLWQDEDGCWHAVHDGDCTREHEGTAYDMVAVIASVNTCMAPMPITRWMLHVYPDGHAGLRGFSW